MSVPQWLGRIVGPVLGLLLFTSAGWVAPGFTVAQEPPAGLDSVVAVATTGCASLALRADGTVWGWGCNSSWNLGATAPGGAVVAGPPIQAEGLDQVRGIAFGDGHGLAVRADGTVWGWGLNDHGQVGVPRGENCPHHPQPCVQAPVPVPGLSGVKAVAATGNSSFALTADGAVWAWGANGGGELGTEDSTDSQSPIRVEGLTDISQVSGAATHVTALRGDGTVWSWGAPNTQTTPTQVSDLEGVVAVAAGLSRDLALTADGTVWAWGEEGNPAPAAVAGLGPVTAIVGGGLLSGAVAADGTVWIWGVIAVGAPPSPPTSVKDLTNTVALAMGTEGNLALQADGTVWVWNQYGKQQQVPAPAAGTPTP